MFCRKCGKQLSDNDMFCSSCGESTDGQSQSAQAKAVYNAALNNASAVTSKAISDLSSKGIYTVSSIGSSILFIFLLFMKWLEVPLLRGLSSMVGGPPSTGSYSILKLLLSLKSIVDKDFLPDQSRTFMIVLIITLSALLAMSIYFLGRYIYEYFSKNKINIEIFQSGLNYLISLSAICFIGMIAINYIVSDKTYGMYDNALSLTGVAYFTGIAAIAARFILVKRLDEEIKQKNNSISKAQ